MNQVSVSNSELHSRFTWKSSKTTAGRLLAHLSLSIALVFVAQNVVLADEFVFDESLTDLSTVSGIDVPGYREVIVDDQSQLFNERGEISSGQLYSLFEQQGVDAFNDVVDGVKLRFNSNDDVSGALNSIDLRMDVENGERSFSIEKIRFNQPVDDAGLLPIAKPAPKPKAEAASEPLEFSFTRMGFVSAFAAFWIALFAVLFRLTAPRASTTSETTGVASVAS